MIITFKTLQQKTFKIEIEDTEKVKVLKEKISSEKGDEFPVEGQKLIYAGKILDDEKTLSEYNIDTVKNFVVVMAVKPKAKPVEKPKETTLADTSSAASSTAATTTPAPSTTPTEIPTTAPASVTTAESTNTTTTTPVTGLEDAESALLTGSALENSVTELMSLGYSREQVMRALNSSFHNADRAAEYLLSGNIPDIGGEDVPAEGEETSAVPPVGGGSAPAAGGGGAAGDIAFLSSLPQFQLMRNQVRQNPETLPQLLQEIGQSNPQLLALISQNQQRFIDLLNAPDEPAVGGGQGGAPSAGAGGFQIQVTPEEKASIDRIVAMGFPESEVIQAFFACEKNEQLTINFLLGGM